MAKRSLIAVLIMLLFMYCPAFAEDAVFDSWPEPLQALRDADRETENILAYDIYLNKDMPEAALFLALSGDTVQLTVLESEEDGSWLITGRNDTIPASMIASPSTGLAECPAVAQVRIRTNGLWLEMHRSIPSYTDGEPGMEQYYISLDFQKTPEGVWALRLVCDVPFEEEEEGRCPYHLLFFTDGGWEYEFYEEIMDDAGWWIDRSERILRKTVPEEEMAPYTDLSKLDVPAFLAFLHALAPEEYEHPPANGYYKPAASPPADPEREVADCVYYNPYGGKYYHADPACPSVSPQYLPMTEIPVDRLSEERFGRLQPCPQCVYTDHGGK